MKAPEMIIKKVQLTEKGVALTEKANKYFLEVARDANKIEIKKAVEKLFNVKVAKVNTMNYEGKKKRSRSFRYGKRPDWKRAVVTLQEGYKIETV
jgi:large subunit ribosomal protein L23